MKTYKIILSFCCSVFLLNDISGQQVADSSGSVYFSGFFNFPEKQKGYRFGEDSMLQSAFFYDLVKQQEVYVPRTGNPGAASYNFFQNLPHSKPLPDGFSQFEPYIFDPIRNKSNPAQRRFTNINYHIGSKKEQHILVRHEQKIRPWMVAGLDFGALSSQSDFSRTLNTNRNFDIYFGYEARSKVYRSYISYTSDRVLNQENGGISSDSVFENASSLNTKTLPISLPEASIKHRIRDYLLKQELNLTRLFIKADSSYRADEFNKSSLVLSHSLWWNRKSVLFTSVNPDSGYFDNIYFDSTTTYDSSFYNDLYQVAMLEYTSGKSTRGGSFSLGAGFEYQETRYTTGPADTVFRYGSAIFSAGYKADKFNAAFTLSKSVTGDFRDSYKSQMQFSYTAGLQSNEFYLVIGAGKRSQTAKEMFYVSNHFTWNNRFDLVEEYDLAAGFLLRKFRLNIEARSRTVKNLVFYREDYLPQAFGDFVNVSDLSVTNSLIFGKFGLDDKISFSKSGNENVAPVPLFSLFSAIYYQNRFFKNVLGFKAGFDVSYFSEYYGYGYMPATGIFYVQEEKQIGNYPQLGVFVNLKIKSAAKLFIRLDHFNAGLTDRKYYGALHYPLPGRTFKFGVSWDLID